MLTPHELKNKEFTKSLRGYSTEEVDEHIAFIVEKYSDLYRAYDELEKKLKITEAQLDSVKSEEDSIRGALINAQKASKKIIDDANEQADVIMRSAKTNCDRLMSELRSNVKDELNKLEEIKSETKNFKAALFKVYNTHINMIESISPESDDAEIDNERVEELTSVVINRIKNDLDKLDPVITGFEAPYEDESDVPDADVTVPAEMIIPDNIDEPMPEKVTAVRDADQISLDEMLAPVEEVKEEPKTEEKPQDNGDSIVNDIKKLNSEVNKNTRDDDEEFLKLLRMASGKGDMTSTEAFEMAYDGKKKD